VRSENSQDDTRTRGLKQDGVSQSESNSDYGSDATSTYRKISYEAAHANMAAHQRARNEAYGAARDALSAEVCVCVCVCARVLFSSDVPDMLKSTYTHMHMHRNVRLDARALAGCYTVSLDDPFRRIRRNVVWFKYSARKYAQFHTQKG
jgi:hypothetical protein